MRRVFSSLLLLKIEMSIKRSKQKLNVLKAWWFSLAQGFRIKESLEWRWRAVYNSDYGNLKTSGDTPLQGITNICDMI